MNEQYYLNFKWDKFVGRRQPPLRAFLVYDGLIWWLNRRFNHDFSNLFLFFSTKKESDVITDSFVNIKLNDKLLKVIIDDLDNDIVLFQNDLKEFEKNTKNLLKFSRSIENIKKNGDINNLFDDFCELWKKFGPSLIFIIFLAEACENEIIKEQEDKQKAQTDLLKLISYDVDSVLFNIKRENKKKNRIHFSEKYEGHISLLKNLIKFRDWRKKVYDDCWYTYSKIFFSKVGLISGLNRNIDWVSPNVIRKMLRNKIDFKFTNDALVFYNNETKKIEINYGDSAISLKEKIIASLFKKEIKGNIANSGYVCGKARIIEPHTLVENFKYGNIIVSKMTTPDLIKIIKRASAIVTDEGGITCHAAIISREMNIPCIIGTKIATKVLKDGDLVEVDANKGIVRIIKKSNLKLSNQ